MIDESKVREKKESYKVQLTLIYKIKLLYFVLEYFPD